MADSPTPPDSDLPARSHAAPTVSVPPTSAEGGQGLPPPTADTAPTDTPSAGPPLAVRRPSVQLPKDSREALRLMEQALHSGRRPPWYYNMLALAYVRTGQADRAAQQIEAGRKVDPRWYPALNGLVLALARRQLGQEAEVRRWLEQVRQDTAATSSMHAQDRLFYDCLRREAEAAPPAAGKK